MPPFETFRDAESDYATLAHELTHWTENPQRLCRDLGRKSWGAGYAAEEFVAELGSASVCADLNLALETLEENAAYIASCRRDFRSEHITPHKRRSVYGWHPPPIEMLFVITVAYHQTSSVCGTPHGLGLASPA
jgi:hypothetical protein